MHRLFVAIDIPDEYMRLLAQLRDNSLQARWTPMEQYHLTLRFIGDTDENMLARIQNRLSDITHDRFSCNISGLNVFPSRSKPCVLVVRIEENPDLSALFEKVDGVLSETGVEKDRKPFRPHITIARFKYVRSEDVGRFISRHASFELEPFTVSSFYLYKSVLQRSGAVHTRLARFDLD